jgi:hypothetical protein
MNLGNAVSRPSSAPPPGRRRPTTNLDLGTRMPKPIKGLEKDEVCKVSFVEDFRL